MLDHIRVLQEESERVCGRALPIEIIHLILLKWGGLQTPAAAAVRKRMSTPLFAGRPESIAVPFGTHDCMHKSGWAEGILTAEPDNPAYDISMALSASRFMFPCHGQRPLKDGRLNLWKVARVPRPPHRAFPWRRDWLAKHPVSYWEAAAVASGVPTGLAEVLAPLCAPTDLKAAWAMYCQVDIEPGNGMWVSILSRLRFTCGAQHLAKTALAMLLYYAMFTRLYGMSGQMAGATTAAIWAGTLLAGLWVERAGRRMVGHAMWEELREHYQNPN